jgi:hypothetical protein
MNLAHLFAQKLYTVVMKPSDCMHKLESVGRRSGTVPKARGDDHDGLGSMGIANSADAEIRGQC